MTDMDDMKDDRPHDYEVICILKELAGQINKARQDGREHRCGGYCSHKEFASQITQARQEDDSPTREVAFATIMCALTQMAREILHLDPYSVLGVLEIAKAGVLHGYFEIMTKDNMEQGR